MLFTDVQRSVRLNKKKKSTNTSPYPDEVIDRLARAFYPAILACWNSVQPLSYIKKERQILRFDVQYLVHLAHSYPNFSLLLRLPRKRPFLYLPYS